MPIETFDQSDEKTWHDQKNWQRQWQRQRQRHFENTFKGRSLRPVTFETFDQSDEETWHDQQRQRHSENTTTNTYMKLKCEIVVISDSWEPEFMTIIVWQFLRCLVLICSPQKLRKLRDINTDRNEKASKADLSTPNLKKRVCIPAWYYQGGKDSGHGGWCRATAGGQVRPGSIARTMLHRLGVQGRTAWWNARPSSPRLREPSRTD